MTAQKPSSRLRFFEYLALMPIYSGLVTFFYSTSFWNNFNINPLDYLSLGDLVSSALFPLSILIGLALMVTFPWVNLIQTQSEKEETFLKRPEVYVCVLCLALARLVMTSFALTTFEYLFAACVAVGTTFMAIREVRVLKGVPFDSLRAFFLFVTILLPFEAGPYGEANAKDIITGSQYLYTYTEKLPMEAIVPYKGELKFLGKLGDHFFFCAENCKSTIIIFGQHLPVLELWKHKEIK